MGEGINQADTQQHQQKEDIQDMGTEKEGPPKEVEEEEGKGADGIMPCNETDNKGEDLTTHSTHREEEEDQVTIDTEESILSGYTAQAVCYRCRSGEHLYCVKVMAARNICTMIATRHARVGIMKMGRFIVNNALIGKQLEIGQNTRV